MSKETLSLGVRWYKSAAGFMLFWVSSIYTNGYLAETSVETNDRVKQALEEASAIMMDASDKMFQLGRQHGLENIGWPTERCTG